jgi:hypothetical protein
MAKMGTVSAVARTLSALVLALLLGLRLLSPAGFMPAFERGVVTIVACPDTLGAAAPAHHHDSPDRKTVHQPCPYAAASALGALPGQWVPAAALPGLAIVLLAAPSFAFVERHRANERPHPTGPPLVA